MSRLSLRPLRLTLPTEDDIQLALKGDKAARRRVNQQRCRYNKRERDIVLWDIENGQTR